MLRRPQSARPRPATAPAAALLLALALAASLAPAALAARLHPGGAPTASSAHAEAARVAAYWTPARMLSARPLDEILRGASVPAPGSVPALATASFKPVATPEAFPYSVNGRVFIRRGKFRAYCSGTAINSSTRQLVLTAGHCVNSGRGGEEGEAPHVWSNFLQFVPAYNGGLAPFGSFVARRGHVYAPSQWVKGGNPDYDMGAFLTFANSEGVNLADAVGGGATIVTDLDRHQSFQTFGYPGETTRMQGCSSAYIGDDPLTAKFPGPPTMAIRCHWLPGASGGGWTISEGTEIDGLTSYLHLNQKVNTYGPYFSAGNVGKLVKGL